MRKGRDDEEGSCLFHYWAIVILSNRPQPFSNMWQTTPDPGIT